MNYVQVRARMKYDIINVNPSWDRNFKGYYYERYNKEMLRRNNIPMEEYNPDSYQEWLKHTNTNFDIRSNGYSIECKLTLTYVYDSWVERDWLSRDCDIYVTNNKFNISYESKEKIRKLGRKLFDIFELIEFLMLKGNKSNLNIKRIVNDTTMFLSVVMLKFYGLVEFLFKKRKTLCGVQRNSNHAALPIPNILCLAISAISQCLKSLSSSKSAYSYTKSKTLLPLLPLECCFTAA